MVLCFDEFELDRERYELTRAGELLRLEPKVFEVLAYLVENRERVVGKDELLETLWPGEFVSESVLPSNVAQLRRILGDAAASPRFIKTVYGRGYQFVADVAEARADAVPSGADAAREGDPALAAFVGRAPALDSLAHALDRAEAGSGRLVLVVGEPGIGKTRTVDELVDRARRRGVRVLVGRCHEGEGAPALWPWCQVLRAGLRDRSPESLPSELGPAASDIALLVPELREFLPGIPEESPADLPEEARFRMFDAVTSVLLAQARSEPLVVVLDDLHWADRASLRLLSFLVRELRDARLLVVGAYRDVEVRRGQPLAQVLGELTSEPHCARLELAGLDAAEVEQFLVSATGAPVPADLVAAIHRRTGGNPYFVGEVTRLLHAEGRLDAQSAATRLPEGVRDAIGRRLDRLSDRANRVLTLASVLGSEFALPPLEALSELGRGELLEVLDEALRTRILEDSPRSVGRFTFSHALVRETLYEEISTPRRIALHRQAGEALEALHAGEPESALAELAHHFFQAAPGGDVDRAIAYCRRAAELASGLAAFEESAGHYENALEAIELTSPVDERLRADLLLSLGNAWACAGERDRSRETFQRAAEVARRLGDAERLARAAVGFGSFWEFAWGPDPVLREHLEEAIAAFGPEPSALRARMLARLSGTHPYLNDEKQRRDLAREAVTIARQLDDREALLDAINAATFEEGLGPPSPDALAQRERRVEELMALARRPHVRGRESMMFDPEWMAHDMRSGSFLLLGDMPGFEQAHDELRRVVERTRQLYQRFELDAERAGRLYVEGRLEEADRLLDDVSEMSRRLHPNTRSFPLVARVMMARDRGPDLLPPSITNRAISGRLLANIQHHFPWVRAMSEAVAMHAEWLMGRMEELRTRFERARSVGFASSGDMGWMLARALESEIAILLSDREAAALVRDLLAPHAHLNVLATGGGHVLGSAAHFVGILSDFLGEPDEAERQLRAALAFNTAMCPSGPVTARTQLALAGVLAPRDPNAARELHAPAAFEIRRLGLHGLDAELERVEGALEG